MVVGGRGAVRRSAAADRRRAYLHDGSVIQAKGHDRPAAGRSMLDQVSALLDSIPKEKLGQLLDRSFKGLNGFGG